MQHQIAAAVPHPDHTVTVTWTDGVTGTIGLTWPGEVDFSADGLRRDEFPLEQNGEKPGAVASAE
jgi:hypothetical protein